MLLIGALVLRRELDRGWVPHDEGALGQAAERVLHGELPHRDFDDIYTGLLSYLHAVAFRIGGVSVNTLRIPLFWFTMLWLAAIHAIARRFTPPFGAGLVALTCFVYAVPNYRSPIPSWYVLFCATFGTLALVRWHETARRHWLVLAGAAGGIAVLFKLSGVFYTGGGLLALLAASALPDESREPAQSLIWLRRVAGVVGTAGVLGLMLVTGLQSSNAVFRFVPAIALVIASIMVAESHSGGRVARERIAAARRVLGPYLLGAALPLICFMLPYLLTGGLGHFVEGTFVTPFRRLASATKQPPAVDALVWVLPVAWLLWSPGRRWGQRTISIAAITWLGALAIMARSNFHAYQTAWLLSWALPVLVAAALLHQSFAHRGGAEMPAVGVAARTIGIVAVCSMLIEFPFAASIYTLYSLPLSMLALVALVRARALTPTAQQAAVAIFYLAFGACVLIPGDLSTLGNRFVQHPDASRLELQRAHLRVRSADSAVYASLIPFVKQQSQGRVLWAGPDAPEIYFLSGVANRTRTLFDFLDTPAEGAAAPYAQIRATLVVIKQHPGFSGRISRAQLDSLRAVLPQQREFADFLVLWR